MNNLNLRVADVASLKAILCLCADECRDDVADVLLSISAGLNALDDANSDAIVERFNTEINWRSEMKTAV